MRLSIVIPVLNSHEIVRRQILHFWKSGFFEWPDVEIILMDDGSDPPLSAGAIHPPNFRIVPTNDTREWTWAVARNAGARLASGRNLVLIDIDHILTAEAADEARRFDGDRFAFRRELAVLDESGSIKQDRESLLAYGLIESRLNHRKLSAGVHPNMFCMRRTLFWEMGGYREDLVGQPYPAGEDSQFKKRFLEFVAEGRATGDPRRPTLYLIPSGQYCGDVDANPFGLFHGLSRKSKANPWYTKPRSGVRSMAEEERECQKMT